MLEQLSPKKGKKIALIYNYFPEFFTEVEMWF